MKLGIVVRRYTVYVDHNLLNVVMREVYCLTLLLCCGGCVANLKPNIYYPILNK